MKRIILSREKFISSRNYAPLYEYAPFANDINWGDSLVGRLINSISRKAAIAFNRNRIDSIINQMKALFSQLEETKGIEATPGTMEFLTISTLLDQLTKQVDGNENIDIIKS